MTTGLMTRAAADAAELAALQTTAEIMDARAAQYLQVATQYGDARPYDRTRIIDLARVHLRNSVEALIDLGRCLILIREGERSGAWRDICERELGISRTAADRLIQAAVKYHSPGLTDGGRRALIASGKTKMFELMMLDDEPLNELADGGSVAGIELDDIDRMGSRDLRAALRAAREDGAAKDRVLAAKSATIDKLATEIEKSRQGSMLIQVAVADPDEQRTQLLRELTARAAHAEIAVRGDLALAIAAVREHCDQGGDMHSADQHIAGALAAVAAAVDELRALYVVADLPTGRHAGAWLEDAVANQPAGRAAEHAQAVARAHAWAAGEHPEEIGEQCEPPSMWVDPEDRTHIYRGEADLPGWMLELMDSMGYVAAEPGDVAAFLVNYMVQVDAAPAPRTRRG